LATVNKLTPLRVNSLKAPGKYAAGLGLYIVIRRPGDKAWAFRYMVNGRARQLGLGPLHTVSLAEARNRAREARQLILDGRDPIEVRHEARAAAKIERLKTMTFRQAANDFLQTAKIESFKNDKHRKQWRSTLEQYAFPVLGDLPLQSIDTALVLKALMPVLRRAPETGARLRGRIERVIDWAKPLGLFVGDNPAKRELLKDHLPMKPITEHHKAMPYADLPAFVSGVRNRNSTSARALEFCILTATRTSEVIGARWSEIDLDAAVWSIPAARMKAKRDHRVPLSHRAVEILRELLRQAGKIKNGQPSLIFPLSNMAMLELLRGMAGNGYTVHGFRSAFSDWARDRTGYARDVIEMALAHTIKDKSEAAYRRGDALDKRRRLMGEWSRFCETVIDAVDHDNVRALRA
jgi:integrase